MLSGHTYDQDLQASIQFFSSRRERHRTTRERTQPRYLFLCLIIAVILFDEFAAVAAGRNYYDILGVSRDADSATIKRAFRKLAVKYHPDKNPGDKNAEKMYVELNNAYEVLADSSKRQRYDMYGEDGVGSGGQGDEDEFDPFGGMFGGFGRRQRRQEERRVKDVTIPLSVTLETLYNGGVIEAVHKRRVICARWGECEKKCDKCGGTGYIVTTRRLGPGFVQQMRVPCPVCGGTGKIGVKNCKACPKGQFEEEEKQLLIDIERGMTDGQTITFDSQTDEVPDHVPGNVHFEISTQEHETFRREGNNLHYNLEISLSEALVGVDRVVKQLDGRLVEIKTDKVISPTERIEIEGEGMPSVEGGPAGNMIVEFWVKFPESLTDKQKELAIELHGKPPSRKETGGGTNSSGCGTNSSGCEEDAEKVEL